MTDLYVCTHRAPPAEYECLEAVASGGIACFRCLVCCYRQGWDARQVREDNARLVREKLGELEKGNKLTPDV